MDGMTAGVNRSDPVSPGEDVQSWVDHPIYVTGLMKTGSTLLLALLDGHPEILAYPDEPSFDRIFRKPYRSAGQLVGDWLYGTPNPLHFGQILHRRGLLPPGRIPRSWLPLPEGFGEDLPDSTDLFQDLHLRGVSSEDERSAIDLREYHVALRRRIGAEHIRSTRDLVIRTMLALHDASRRKETPRFWLFKQPMPDYRPASLQWFFSNFIQGKTIILMRDPRAYVNSLMRHRERRDNEAYGAPRRAALVIWTIRNLERDYELFSRTAEMWGEDRVKVLHYEDLVIDTEGEMRELANFIGVQFDEILSNPTKVGRTVRVPTATEGRGTQVYSDSLEKWKDGLNWLEITLVDAAMDGFYRKSGGPYEPVRSWPVRKVVRVLLFIVFAIWESWAGLLNRLTGNLIRTEVPGINQN